MRISKEVTVEWEDEFVAVIISSPLNSVLLMPAEIEAIYKFMKKGKKK